MLRLASLLTLACAVCLGQSAAPLLSINCGGQAFTGADGTQWTGDQYWTGGDLLYTGSPISGTQDLYLYRSARRGLYGNFSYTIPLASGSYILRLRFAEIAYSAPGQRVFNVVANGAALLTNFDILKEVPPLTIDDKQFNVTVGNGPLQIDVTGVVGYGLLNAIQILPGAPTVSVSPASLSFSGTAGGANPAAQSVSISNTGGGTLSWSAASNQGWLTVSPGSGSGAGSISVTSNLSGLAAGTYSGAVTVTAAGASGSPQTVPVTLSVAAPPPALTLSTTSLAFSATTGGANPASQSVTISNTGGGTLTWSASSNQSWLSISPASGSGGGTSAISANVSGLAAGTYSGAITVTAPGAVGTPKTIQVSLSVGAASTPALSVSPTSLTFSGTAGSASPGPQSASVANTGGGTLTWNASSNQSWLTVSPPSGSGAGTLSISANTTGLTAGTYSGAITVTASGAGGSPQAIPVTLSVAAPAPSGTLITSINCGGAALTGVDGTNWSGDTGFTGGDLAYTGGSINGAADQYLYRSGRRGLFGDFSYALAAPSGSYTLVLKFAEIEYTARGQRVFNVVVNGAPALTNFDILADVPPLTADEKRIAVNVTNGQIQIDFKGVTGYGLINAIQLYSTGSTTPPAAPALAVAPTSLTFNATAGGSNPAAQPLAISNTGGGTLTWTASNTQSWLHLPSNSGSGSANLSIQPNISGLAAGTYTDTIAVSAPGANPSAANVAVTLTLTAAPVPGLSVTPTSMAFSATANGSNPAAQTLSISNSGGGTLSWTASNTQSWLHLSAASGSGGATLTIQPNVTGLSAGTYSDTITIGAPGANPASATVRITFTVAAAPATTPNGMPVMAINCGGGALTGADGTNWSGDQDYTGGDLYYSGSLIGGTQDLYLYRTARRGLYGDFGYSIPLANATYTVVLKFAELEFGSRGQRVFNVLLNNSTVLSNFDILADVPPLTADDKSFAVTVSNGSLRIDVNGVVGLGIISGIEIFSGSGGTTTTPPPPPPPPPPSGTGNSANTDQWTANTNPPQTIDPNGGAVLYNGIQLPAAWPPLGSPTQVYTVPPYLVNKPAVIPIDVGRQLFVDDFLIDQTNLTRVQHQPTMYAGNPVVTPNTQGEDFQKNLALVYSDGVWYDPADHTFKMWYDGGYGNDLSYAVSSDGLNWTKPRIPDAAIANTNMVLQLGGSRDSTTVWMDLHDDPSRKFKLFSYYPFNGSSYLNIYFSPDGIHWTGPQANSPNSLSDRTTAFYNPFRGVWVESARNSTYLPATSTVPADTSVRSRFYSESRDLQTWSPSDPQTSFWTSHDERDPAYPGSTHRPELYNLDGTPYESLLVGLFSWYYPPDGPDLVELGIGFTRDGFHWSRPTRGGGPGNAFIAASNQDGTWNGFNTQSAGGGFLVVGDQLYIYFSGRTSRHSQESGSTVRSTGVAMLRRDGFYSMAAGGGTGTLTTHAVRFSGSHLFVNAAVPSGQLQAEVLDSNGNVIPAFAKNNSAIFTGDSTHREITWSGASLSSLAGQTVKFRFYLTNGDLYSFWVTSSATGASNGYVAAGGPGLIGDKDQ